MGVRVASGLATRRRVRLRFRLLDLVQRLPLKTVPQTRRVLVFGYPFMPGAQQRQGGERRVRHRDDLGAVLVQEMRGRRIEVLVLAVPGEARLGQSAQVVTVVVGGSIRRERDVDG